MIEFAIVALAVQSTAPIPAEVWQSDLRILRRSLDELHPGVERYITPRQFDGRYRDLTRYFTRPRTRKEGFLRLSQFLATIRCGHTYTNFFNQPEATAAELFRGRDKVPFTFRWIGGEIVVTDSGVLPRGTVVRRINGMPAREILRQMMAVARADGASDGKRRDYLGVTGIDGIEAFDVYLPLLYPPKDDKFRLEMREPGASRWTVRTVEAIDLDARNAKAPSSDRNAPAWTFRMASPKLAWLDMPTWGLYNSNWNWKAFLHSTMDRLVADRVPNLVIDLRRNEGGIDVGREIIARLVDASVEPLAFERLVRYRRVPADLEPYLSTWDPTFKNWGSAAVDAKPGWFRLVRLDEDAFPIRPRGPRYTGKVFVLTSPTNSSATFAFLNLAKSLRVATLVGQTTGGNQRGINGGAFFFLTLPGSQIEVDIPLIGYFAKGSVPDSGVEPDVRVAISARDIATGRDPEAEVVKDLIARR